jgi:hypothetical protein
MPCYYRIPDLELDLPAVNSDHACTELHTNGKVMHWLETLVCKLKKQAGLADTFSNNIK